MRTNRVLNREAALALDLDARIQLEKEITDAELELRIHRVPSVSAEDFALYAHRSPWRRYLFDFLGPMADKTILDLGCGYNPTAVMFALAGARKVYACDVSPKAVRYVAELADASGVGDRVVPVIAPAEDLPIEDESLDLIHGCAVLHHLNLSLASKELSRVLRPGGKAGFHDPLGQNPVLEFVRDYVPYKWKKPAKGTDHPLTFAAIAEFAQHFGDCQFRGFGLLSMPVALVLGRRQSLPYQMAHTADEILLSKVPALQRWCRFVVTCVTK